MPEGGASRAPGGATMPRGASGARPPPGFLPERGHPERRAFPAGGGRRRTGGVTAQTLADTLQPLVADLRIEPLTDPNLWGRTINDERYAVIAAI